MLLECVVGKIVFIVLLLILHIYLFDRKQVVDKFILNNSRIKSIYNIRVVALGFSMRQTNEQHQMPLTWPNEVLFPYFWALIFKGQPLFKIFHLLSYFLKTFLGRQCWISFDDFGKSNNFPFYLIVLFLLRRFCTIFS